jgi:hypothetical protein
MYILIAFVVFAYALSVPFVGMRLAQKYLRVWGSGRRSLASFLLFPIATADNRVGKWNFSGVDSLACRMPERRYLAFTAWTWLPSLVVSLTLAVVVAALAISVGIIWAAVNGAAWVCGQFSSFAMLGLRPNGQHT